MAETVDITLLAKLGQDTLAETRAVRRDLADVRRDLADVQGLAVKTVDVLTKRERRNEARYEAMDGRFAVVDARLHGLDQRVSHLKDDLKLTIRSQLMSVDTKVVKLIEERLARRD